MKFSLFLIALGASYSCCRAEDYWNWDDGTVSFKSSGLCVQTEYIDKTKKTQVFLKLKDCNNKGDGYEYDKLFDISKSTTDNSFRFQTKIHPKSTLPKYVCFNIYQGVVKSEDCDIKDFGQYFKTIKTSSEEGLVQIVHKDTGHCLSLSSDSDGGIIIAKKCDAGEKYQLWDVEFLKQKEKFDGDGKKFYLTTFRNASLCMGTKQYSKEHSEMGISPCDTEYPALKGVAFWLGRLDDGYHMIRTLHFPNGSAYGQFACVFTGIGPNGPLNVNVRTDTCDYNNKWQHWKIQGGGGNNVLLVHRVTGKCVKSDVKRSLVVTAECDEGEDYADLFWKKVTIN